MTLEYKLLQVSGTADGDTISSLAGQDCLACQQAIFKDSKCLLDMSDHTGGTEAEDSRPVFQVKVGSPDDEQDPLI